MNLPQNIDLASLGEIYLISNTPIYLYKRLRSNTSVQWMASNLPVQAISEIYEEIQKKKDKAVEDMSLAYGALVSLSFKEYREITPLLENLSTEDIAWAEEIRNLIISHAKPTLIVTTNLPLPVKQPAAQFKANSSTSIVHWTGRLN